MGVRLLLLSYGVLRLSAMSSGPPVTAGSGADAAIASAKNRALPRYTQPNKRDSVGSGQRWAALALLQLAIF